MRKVIVDFSKKIREWDGFGVNYVELAQAIDYQKDPQEYGGFSLLTEDERQDILDMIFGEEGLKPGIIKMFFDPFQQDEENINTSVPEALNMNNYDHETTTDWMRYFVREGLERTRARGDELEIITTLYGPPAWMTKQKFMRGRDLDPAYKLELAKYMIAWIKYLREEEKFPVKYLSLHNEGEDWTRWPLDGSSGNIGTGHDYNMYWSPEQVTEYLKLMNEMFQIHGLEDIGIAPGETTNWYRFVDWGYAPAIVDDPEALSSIGLITSHGFYNGNYGSGFGPHKSAGIDMIRSKRPDLNAWVTSTSWSKMDADFIFEIKSNIYSSKVNAIIPWACIQRPEKWVGGDPNPGTAFRVFEDGTYQVMPGYYFYKQVSRLGQPGMAVVQQVSNDSEIAVIGFSSNGTDNDNGFVIINRSEEDKSIDVGMKGIKANKLDIYRTSGEEMYQSIEACELTNNKFNYVAPAGSVTTFYIK